MARRDSNKRTETAQASNSLPADMRTVPESASEPETKPVFSEGTQTEMDGDLRFRMISEAAYRLYAQRGYVEGFDLDDWFQAEAEVDRLPSDRSTNE
jgi:hypothetical protein